MCCGSPGRSSTESSPAMTNSSHLFPVVSKQNATECTGQVWLLWKERLLPLFKGARSGPHGFVTLSSVGSDTVGRRKSGPSSAVMPLHSLYLRLPINLFRQIAQGNAYSEVRDSKAIPFQPRGYQGVSRARLRVGYWSSELRHHPVSLLTEDVFRLQHERASASSMDTIILALNPDDDSGVSKRIQASVGGNFLRLHGIHHVDIYRKIVEQRLDILIDLDGCCRPPSFSIASNPGPAS